MILETPEEIRNARSNPEWLKRARAFEVAGELFAAGRAYQAILDTEPGHAEAHRGLGAIALRAGQAEAALASFAAALEADPANGDGWIGYIDALFQSGQADEARALFEQARGQGLAGASADALAERIGLPPDDGPDAILKLFDAGRPAVAIERALRIIERQPDDAYGWKVLGLAYKQLGHDAKALAPLLRAAELAPNEAEARFNVALVLQALDRPDEAETRYREALRIDPVHANSRLNLGALCHAAGRFDEAEVVLREALRIRPDDARAQASLGGVLLALGRLNEAETCCRHALAASPCNAAALDTLGIVALHRGCLDEAEARFREALICDPDFAPAHRNLGRTHYRLGRFTEAEVRFRAALRLTPDDAAAHAGLGDALRRGKRPAEAEAAYCRALELSPGDTETENSLGLTFNDAGRAGDALVQFRKVLRTRPGNVSTMSNLAQALLSLGRVGEAVAILREALQQRPDYAALYSNFLFALTLSSGDEQAIFAEHVRYGKRFAALRLAHGNPPDPERILKVGFVSADLHNHAVASYLTPVLPHLSVHPGLELHAYSNNNIEDDTTLTLRAGFAHWRTVHDQDDDALAEIIRADGIDILIDLSGHTGFNRLPMFARKPAPVQASWIGYPNTTGLDAIDYYLCDRWLLPPGQADAVFTEKLVRLCAIAAFQPFAAAPSVNSLPAQANGYATFGSFNRANKINRDTVALWSRLLRAVPDSRMLMGGILESDFCDTFAIWFEEEGIAPARIAFHGRGTMEAYLALHHQVDLCLDTFPYNGGTTTNHALWMGVPTLTLAGRSARDRAGAAILSQVGLQAFVAMDDDDFVARGVHWATHPDELAALRTSLRKRVDNAATRRPETVAAGLALALRVMWRRWCGGLPPAAFGQVWDDDSGTIREDTA
jgi:predicted O-linked N-acetylglucosamine transferase (SPINDLY family)